MTRQMLRGIRVKSKEELEQRIYAYFVEVNELPVVYHWKHKLSEINPGESVKVDTLPTLSSKKVQLISRRNTSSATIELEISAGFVN